MKKEETRFSIRFCPADPRHQFAMEVLNAAGRRKATIIADAICDYFARLEENERVPTISTKTTIANALCKNVPNADDLLASVNTSVAESHEESDNFHSDDSYDDEMQQAVLAGLSAFHG